MIIKKMTKIFTLLSIFTFTLIPNLYCNDLSFDLWLSKFKKEAIGSGISKKVVEIALKKKINVVSNQVS